MQHPLEVSHPWRFQHLPGARAAPCSVGWPGRQWEPPALLSMPCQPRGAEAEAPPDPACALSLQSKGSLEVTESQSADAEPPPPPKPDLSRYTGLRTHLTLATTEGKEGTRALAATGRGTQGCTRQARSQGRRADPEHISIPGPVYVAPCPWRSLRDAHSKLCSAGGRASMALSGATVLPGRRRRSGGGPGSAAQSVCGWLRVGLARGGMRWAEPVAAASCSSWRPRSSPSPGWVLLPTEGCAVCVSH